jgi:ABC-type branched-subunit amino acid transport system ATPase component
MLETKGLTLHYGASQILYGIDLVARAGEMTCIMVTNGVGKTSFFKAASGTHLRSGGSILLDGKEVPRVPPQGMAMRGLGYVPQGRMIFPLLTVGENLQTAYATLPKSEHKEPAEIYDLFPVLKDMDHRRGGRFVGWSATTTGHCTGDDDETPRVAAGRTDRRHPAEYHPADRPGDQTASVKGRYGHCAGRAVFRLCI